MSLVDALGDQDFLSFNRLLEVFISFKDSGARDDRSRKARVSVANSEPAREHGEDATQLFFSSLPSFVATARCLRVVRGLQIGVRVNLRSGVFIKARLHMRFLM